LTQLGEADALPILRVGVGGDLSFNNLSGIPGNSHFRASLTQDALLGKRKILLVQSSITPGRMNTNNISRWVKPFTSLKLTVFCLGCAMILVFVGTLGQVNIGVYEAENRYFKSFFLYFTPPGATLKSHGFPVAIWLAACLS